MPINSASEAADFVAKQIYRRPRNVLTDPPNKLTFDLNLLLEAQEPGAATDNSDPSGHQSQSSSDPTASPLQGRVVAHCDTAGPLQGAGSFF